MVRHVQYVVRPFNLATCEYGPPQTYTDPPCDPACTITGPGLYLTTRTLDLATCTFSEPVCVKVGPCVAGTVVDFDASGTFHVPAGITSVYVEAWPGGSGGAPGLMPGGGGGAYAAGTVAVTPGTDEPVIVGFKGGTDPINPTNYNGGASYFRDAGTVMADPGKAPTSDAAGGLGGLASASVGTVRRSGGNGGLGYSTSYGGGGGGSGSPTADGAAGANATAGGPGVGGTGAATGGTGGNVPGEVPATPGAAPGAGAGGATVTVSGDPEQIITALGGMGRVRISYGSECV